MAVERMKVVSIVGKLSDLEKVSRSVILNGSVHMLNAFNEISSNFIETIKTEDGEEIKKDLSKFRAYISEKDFSADEKITKSLYHIFDLKPEVKRELIPDRYEYQEFIEDLRIKYETVREISTKADEKLESIQKKQKYIEHLSYFKGSDLDNLQIGELLGGKQLSIKLIMFSKENYGRLRFNMENIPAIVFQLATIDEHVAAISFTPMQLAEEVDRIFVSLNYRELEIPSGYEGTIGEVIDTLSREIAAENAEIEACRESVQRYRQQYEDSVKRAHSIIEMEKEVESVKEGTALSRNLFYMFGFIPTAELDTFRKSITETYSESAVTIMDDPENYKSEHEPPTRMKNNAFVKGFETLIHMYGLPNYNENDPTPFFAVSYMLLFGAMFGDLGQGLVVLLLGLFVNYKNISVGFGQILTRLGISSMIFGALYGSIFGSEELIPALVIRPMENMNTMLLSAIVLGVILITVSYIYSFINLFRRKNLEEALFGKEGIVGFAFFWTLIITIVSKATGIIKVPLAITAPLMVILLLLMVFKLPLTIRIEGAKSHHEKPGGDYYIESGFGIIEAVLSLVSNVISFIRVGAFALNHVGLYIAFATMAEMANSGVSSTIILIVGNILIIGLEGLIVFIQTLRLEYYELFSRYYTGAGIKYRPAKLMYTKSAREQALEALDNE